MKTIHMIAHAHLDPVWLWPWNAGLDEALNTAYSICNLLDRNPELLFTQGDAWIYDQIERIDPPLMERIKSFIDAGRWEVIGGWYMQPDCNLPSYNGLERQISLGRRSYERLFGEFPTTAYNIDSFGHAASIPRLLAEAGQTHYIMMRPMKHEMTLPARFFRWRGHEDGHEIITYRIPRAYNCRLGITREHVAESLTELPDGLEHTMSFFACSDHGGGPTQTMIDWIRENEYSVDGARMVFSTPSRFFEAVKSQEAGLPLVTGELQIHAIGCYSVYRRIKLETRRAEHALAQAEIALSPDRSAQLEEAWRKTCFAHFHDTLCGSSVAGAYPQIHNQLGYAATVADDSLQIEMRIGTRNLPPDPRQRFVIRNYSGVDFDDWIEHEPWTEFNGWQPGWGLIDESGEQVPFQVMLSEAFTNEMARLLFRLKVPAGEARILRIAAKEPIPSLAESLPSAKLLVSPGGTWQETVLQLVEDLSDTWSHEMNAYDGPVTAEAVWQNPRIVDDGPLMCCWIVDGRIGSSDLNAEWRVYEGEPFIELRLRVFWQEHLKLLRLLWPQPSPIASRLDGIPGETLRRATDGIERPVRDVTLLELASGKKAGLVLHDTYSLSAAGSDLRLTLLRSALMAQGGEIDMTRERKVFSDQGPQEFKFRFYPSGACLDQLEKDAMAFHRPPLIADDTRGMPWRPVVHQYERPL